MFSSANDRGENKNIEKENASCHNVKESIEGIEINENVNALTFKDIAVPLLLEGMQRSDVEAKPKAKI